jgi:hypothetical protein
MATTKASLTSSVPKPAMQGGHRASAETVQKTKIQPKRGPEGTGMSNILYTKQPAGTKGVGTTAGKPMK